MSNSDPERNTIIVTPNGNVAFHLKRCEQSAEYHPGQTYWIPRPVYTLDEWIDELATPLLEEVYPDYTLLKPVQEKALWHDIISTWNPRRDRFNVTDKQGVPLLALANTVRQAASCWKSLRQYHALETPYIEGLKRLNLGLKLWNCQCPQDSPSKYYLRQLNEANLDSRDARMDSWEFSNFVTWQRQFQERCQKNRWIDGAVLPSLVAAHLTDAEYDQRLRTAGKMPDKIIAYGFLEAPEELTLDTDVCSCTLTPQRTELLKAFLSCGCELVMAADMNDTGLYGDNEKLTCAFTCKLANQNTTDAQQGGRQRSVYETTENEFRDIAQQVLDELGKSGNDKPTNIGVIVPDLEARRESVMQAFDEILCPQCLLPEHYAAPRPYTVSLGKSLDQVPIVNTALRFLRSLSEEMPLTALTDILFSKYFNNRKNRLIASANFNIKLRKRRQYSYTLNDLLKAQLYVSSKNKDTQDYTTKEIKVIDCLPSNLRQSLLDIKDEVESSAKKHSLKDWGEFFQSILGTMGWGTSSKLTDDELRAKRRFLDLVELWPELDKVSSANLDLTQAVLFLTEQAKDAIFQVKAAYKARVHISGILETVGLRFDRVFIMNYTDQSWPSLGALQPYLPIELQKTLKMPVAEDKLRQAKWVNQRLSSLATKGVVSFANTSVDDNLICKLNISQLCNLENTPAEPVPEAETVSERHVIRVEAKYIDANDVKELSQSSASYCEQIMRETFSKSADEPNLDHSEEDASTQRARANTNLETHPNAPIPPSEPEKLKGGSQIINKQLSCPFSAMVEKRWGCEELEEGDDRLNALDNGSIIHKTMELIWGGLNRELEAKRNTVPTEDEASNGSTNIEKASDMLHFLTEDKIKNAVKAALAPFRDQHPHYGEVYFELAETRAIDLLKSWFDPEKGYEATHAKLGCADSTKKYDVECEQNSVLRLPVGAADSEPHLELDLRLDRRDSLDSGIVISDYKTGKYRPADWYPEFPDVEPPKDIQLPLYALLYADPKKQQELRGLGFDILKDGSLNSIAILSRRDNGCCGVRYANKITKNLTEYERYKLENADQSDPDHVKWSVSLQFSNLMEYWEKWANILANEIIQGIHPPLPGKDACKYCKYGPICRQNLANDEDNESGQTEGGND